MQNVLARTSLMTQDKVFVTLYLDQGGITFDEGYNEQFYQENWSIQYDSSLALSKAIRGTSKKGLQQNWSYSPSRVDVVTRNLVYLFWFLKMKKSITFPM